MKSGERDNNWSTNVLFAVGGLLPLVGQSVQSLVGGAGDFVVAPNRPALLCVGGITLTQQAFNPFLALGIARIIIAAHLDSVRGAEIY